MLRLVYHLRYLRDRWHNYMSTLEVHASSITANVAQDVLILLTRGLRLKLAFLRFLVELPLIKE
jgi:hypothetical protein